MAEYSKHIVCYSGGVSSALVGAMVLKKFGPEKTVWVNHQVNAEPLDVDRFEQEFASYHKMPITYVNAEGFDTLTPYEVAEIYNRFFVPVRGQPTAMCTYVLKTEPFEIYLSQLQDKSKVKVYYGFDRSEIVRMTKKIKVALKWGVMLDFPLALWDDKLDESYLDKIGIKAPMMYEVYKHANCIGCIKAKKLHWLCVYVHNREIFDKFEELEDHTQDQIMNKHSLRELRPFFEEIRLLGIPINEKVHYSTFWMRAKDKLKEKKFNPDLFEDINPTLPCDCAV